jgi:hypothetical protein
MTTPQTPPTSGAEPPEQQTAPAPAPPPPPGPPPAVPPAAAAPPPARASRIHGWLGTLTPLSAGLAAFILLVIGFGAGAIVVHSSDSGSNHAPAGGREGMRSGQFGQPGGQPGQPGQRQRPDRQGTAAGGPSVSGPSVGGPNAARGGFGNVTAGTIVSVDGNTMTVRSANGATVKVTISGSTSIRLSQTGSTSDLKAGAPVVVVGPNSDGTVSARSVTSGNGITALGGAFPGS